MRLIKLVTPNGLFCPMVLSGPVWRYPVHQKLHNAVQNAAGLGRQHGADNSGGVQAVRCGGRAGAARVRP